MCSMSHLCQFGVNSVEISIEPSAACHGCQLLELTLDSDAFGPPVGLHLSAELHVFSTTTVEG